MSTITRKKLIVEQVTAEEVGLPASDEKQFFAAWTVPCPSAEKADDEEYKTYRFSNDLFGRSCYYLFSLSPDLFRRMPNPSFFALPPLLFAALCVLIAQLAWPSGASAPGIARAIWAAASIFGYLPIIMSLMILFPALAHFNRAVIVPENRRRALRGLLILAFWILDLAVFKTGYGSLAFYIGVWVTYNKTARPWVYGINFLLLSLMHDPQIDVFVSFLALFSLFMILTNGGHVRNFGSFIDHATEGERAASWFLGPGIIAVHAIHFWWLETDPHGTIWHRLGEFHHFHLELGENIAFAIMGALAASGIATVALGKSLFSFQNVLLDSKFPFIWWGIPFPQRLVKTIILFLSFSSASAAGESPAASITKNYLKGIVDEPRKLQMVLLSALALGLSAGVSPIAAPPLAVIWQDLYTVMGWGYLQLFLFTGIFCFGYKAVLAWRVAGCTKPATRQATKPLNLVELLTLLQFAVLVITHLFLVNRFGPWFTALVYFWDVGLALWTIWRRIGSHPGMSLTIGLLIITIHLVTHDGTAAMKFVAESELFRFAEEMRWLLITVSYTAAFIMSATMDNAATTKPLSKVVMNMLGGIMAGAFLNASTVAGLSPEAQQVVLSATAMMIAILAGSLTASVVLPIANPIVSVDYQKEFEISTKDWFWAAFKWLTWEAFFVGLAFSFFMAYVFLPWYLGL